MMAGSKQPKKAPLRSDANEIELVPDAWPRFERFIKAVAKVPPKHREAPKPKRRRPPKSEPKSETIKPGQ